MDTATGSLTFTGVDLSDTHVVSVSAPAAAWSGGSTVPAASLAAFVSALTRTLADSTQTGSGSVGFSFSVADKAFDFLRPARP